MHEMKHELCKNYECLLAHVNNVIVFSELQERWHKKQNFKLITFYNGMHCMVTECCEVCVFHGTALEV